MYSYVDAGEEMYVAAAGSYIPYHPLSDLYFIFLILQC